MLTFSSDSLPQIVCPMDEDVIPSNPFCSAPPHTEPPPPLLSLSSITPSCANDGISGNRRSGRIQSIRAQTPKKHDDTIDIRETPKPSRQNPSPTRRHRESGNMVQVTQSKQPRVEVNHEQEKHNEDEFDFNFAAYRCQSKQIDQKTSDVSSSAAADVVEPENDGDDAEILDGVKSDMDADVSVENSSASKGWVIGPLFQSFKSKMASFTEIVMSPVKLFRANSPPLSMDQTEKLTVTDETNDVFQTVGDEKQEVEVDLQRINEVEEAENTKPSAFKYCKRISFDTEMSTPSCEPADECAITQKEKNSPDPVPFLDDSLTCVVSKQISESIESVISSSCVGLSASQSERAVRVKAPPRKRTGNRSELKRSVSKPLTSELRQKESEICQTNSVQLDSKQTDLFSSSVCFTPPDGAGDGLVRQSIWNNVNNCVNRKTVDAQHLENQFNSDAPAVGLVRPKRGLKVSCQTQEVAKRKKVTATGDLSTDETKNPESLIITSLRGKTRKELTTTKTIEEKEETVKPLRKRQTGSTRANRKGKVGQEMFPTINESVLNSSPDPMLVCSLDQNNVVSENKQKNCSGSKTKQTASNKRLKTKPDLRKPDVNMDSMDLETTLAITSTKRDEEEPLNDVLIRPSNNKNVNKKPLKRKSPTMNSESTLVSTSSVLLTQPGEFNSSTSAQGEENLKPGLNQTSKKSRKGSRAAVKSHESDAQDTDLHPTKENKQTDPVYFEMTPFESKHQPVPAPSQPHLECYVQLNNEVKQLIDNKMTMSAPETDDVFPPDANDNNQSSVTASKLRSRRVGAKARRADKQRRRCRVLHQATHEGEEVTNSVTMEDADLSASGCRSSENKISRRLLRSYSCPEIPSLRLHDAPWTPPFHSPHHNRTHLSHQHHSSHAPLVPHVHKSPRRARRHTVCSVEVEREIAPLCLRKEIYPTRRSAPHDGVAHFSPGVALSPSASLTALASCFLSSPLAFLSKKVDIRGAASSPSASNHVSSSSPLTCPSSSSSWQLPGFLQRNDSSRGTSDSGSSVNPLVCEIERRRQREEEDDGEDTSSSSQEFEDVALREEKALSDSEIKVVQKHEERGKVSSIRIRKTLPKPQNNLTPMGLPKPIRLKKKEFSLEEIYTNKNFSKPPESRLETIFEVPLNRRNGSESWFGQRRVKRFLEFLEVGEVRKPKKPLVGVGKASINSSSRTRRGSFTKDEALLNVQDVDSLLCAKLDQLNLWLIHDQTES